MTRLAIVLGTSLGAVLAVAALLLAALSISLSRWDAVLVYGVFSAAAFAFVVWLMRRARSSGVAAPERRAPRRAPRQPIRLPVRGAVLTFAGWYVATVVMSYLANGRIFPFDLAVVAPFAAFLLSVLTFAGRHIAFRLTAEETDGER